MAAWKAKAGIDFLAYLLGNYLGALTLTPVLLALHQQVRIHGTELRTLSACPLIRETVCVMAPCLLALIIATRVGNGATQELGRLAMIVPVLVATARHGWHGGALVGMLASVAIACTTRELLDPAMIRTQVILALAISGSLIAGHRIAHRAIRKARSY